MSDGLQLWRSVRGRSKAEGGKDVLVQGPQSGGRIRCSSFVGVNVGGEGGKVGEHVMYYS